MSPRHIVTALFVIAMVSVTSFAQQQPAPGDRPDFAKMREMMEQRMKEMMGATDDEWSVLKPKIEKVQKAQRDQSSFGGMMMLFGGGPGGPGGGGGGRAGGFFGGDEKPSALQEKSTDLAKSLQNKDATPDELKEKLKAVRDARVKAKADFLKAQEELRDVVSVRQEATLVMLGMLE